MPGTILVDPATFISAISMGAVAREIFGQPGVQERTKDTNLPKWTVGVAVAWAPDSNGITAPSEVLNVTVVSDTDPATACPPGTAVQFESLRAGVSAPEQRTRSDGSTRVSGGRLYWSAASVKPVAQQSWKKNDAA
jgi:hypothetical protein